MQVNDIIRIRYFDVRELVCPHVYERYGERSLQFIDPRLRDWLFWFRTTINKPVTINNWHKGGQFSQRGLRCNMCDLFKNKTNLYLSGHVMFRALDFNVEGMTDDEVRDWIEEHKNEMPVNIRIENATAGWVHIDVNNITVNKLIYFNA